MSKYKSFLDIREKAELTVCIAVVVIGTPLCWMLGERAALDDFKTLHPVETPATK